MSRRLGNIALVAWIVLSAIFMLSFCVTKARANNASQTTLDRLTCSGTIAVTNTWQQVIKLDKGRAQLLLQNVATHNMGFIVMPYSNNNATPAATGIGSQDVFTLLPNGSYEPDGGWIDGGEFWIMGTATDVFSCKTSPAGVP